MRADASGTIASRPLPSLDPPRHSCSWTSVFAASAARGCWQRKLIFGDRLIELDELYKTRQQRVGGSEAWACRAACRLPTRALAALRHLPSDSDHLGVDHAVERDGSSKCSTKHSTSRVEPRAVGRQQVATCSASSKSLPCSGLAARRARSTPRRRAARRGCLSAPAAAPAARTAGSRAARTRPRRPSTRPASRRGAAARS